jgi:deoxyribonuclease V
MIFHIEDFKKLEALHSIVSKTYHLIKTQNEKGFRIACVCDVSYHQAKKKECAIAAAVSCDLKSGSVIEKKVVVSKDPLPYIPGYFFIRELPPIVSVITGMRRGVDIIFVNGHGVLHPKGSGLAVYVGLFFDKPSVGIAKKLFVGQIAHPDQSISPIIYGNKILGKMIILKNSGRRYYISPGYKINVEKAAEIVSSTLTKGIDLMYMAHAMSKNALKKPPSKV